MLDTELSPGDTDINDTICVFKEFQSNVSAQRVVSDMIEVSRR